MLNAASRLIPLIVLAAVTSLSCKEMVPGSSRADRHPTERRTEDEHESDHPREAWAAAQAASDIKPNDRVVLAAAGEPVRARPDTIDVKATVAALVAMHCKSYLYEIPHGTDAWAKLPAFADAAAAEGIDVFIYLEPWTLAHRNGRNAENEPFGTDYVRWCDEIGKVAIDHPNVRGVVMDDFQVNTTGDEHFTPQMVHQMRAALRSHRSDLQFLPVVYFYIPLPPLLEAYGREFGDGAILCYPRGQREVEVTRRYLTDSEHGALLSVELPRHHSLKPGQGTYVAARLDKNAARDKRLRFYFDDQNANARRGRHRVVVRVDGHVVWSRELQSNSVAGNVDVPLKNLKSGSRIEIGIIVDEPSEDAVVHIDCSEVRVIDDEGAIDHRVRWSDELNDGIRFEIAQSSAGQHRWNIPLTLLVAAAPFEHEKRFDEPGTPRNIAGRFSQAVGWAQSGLANGVIAWYPPFTDAPEVVKAISRIYGSAVPATGRQ